MGDKLTCVDGYKKKNGAKIGNHRRRTAKKKGGLLSFLFGWG